MTTPNSAVNQHPPQERRQYPRVKGEIPVKIQQEDGDMVTETENISRSGAYCRVNRYVKPMTKLKISLLLPMKRMGKNLTTKISCEGIVVRAEPVEGDDFYHAAIFFNNISQKDSDSIAEYVNYYLEKG